MEKVISKLEAERSVVISEMTDASDTDRKRVLISEKEEQIRRRRDKIAEIMDDSRPHFAQLLNCSPHQVNG